MAFNYMNLINITKHLIASNILEIYPKIILRIKLENLRLIKKEVTKPYEINIFKSIKSQFNILRICNNEF